jgi:glycosyltransferase involved in cell wall biosynthesis
MVSSYLKRQSAQDMNNHYSVIIPAYNEESFLPETLVNLQKAMAAIEKPGEIIVVDNNSTDSTAEIARQYGVKVVHEPFRQIARARNSGAKAAESRFLVFLDADTFLPPQLLKQALDLLDGGDACGGGTLLNFDSELPFLAGRLVRFWNWLSRNFLPGSRLF